MRVEDLPARDAPRSPGARAVPMPVTPCLGARRDLLPDLPGPVRGQRPGTQARSHGAMGRAADGPRLQGRRPAGCRRAPRRAGRPGRDGAVSHARLRVRLQSPLSHRRLLLGRPAPGWQRGPSPSCSTRRTLATCAWCSMASSITAAVASGAFHHVAEAGAASPFRPWFHLDDERARGRSSPLVVYPGSEQRGRAVGGSGDGHAVPGEASRRVLGYEGWWGLPALPKLNAATRRPGRTCSTWPSTGCGSASTAGAWMSRRRSTGDYWEEFRERCRAVNPDAYLVAEIWHPKPEWLTGQHFDALMNYPLAEAILGYAAGRHLDRAVAGAAR